MPFQVKCLAQCESHEHGERNQNIEHSSELRHIVVNRGVGQDGRGAGA